MRFSSRCLAGIFRNQHILSQTWALLQSLTNTCCVSAFTIHPALPKQRKTGLCAQYAPSKVLCPMTYPRRRERRTTSSVCHTRCLGCVLRISHPLDALLPPRPAELISSQIRLWGSPFEVCPLHGGPSDLSVLATLLKLERSSRPRASPSGLLTTAQRRLNSLGD
jgi:hypothetical protein